MKIKDIVQTVIFLCFLIMVPVFGLAYTLYSQTALQDSEILDKSLGVMIGVFGGVATLAAAYIASLLFNDWKDEKKYELESNLLTKILSEIQPIYIELLRIRSNSHNLKLIDTKFIVKTDYLCNDRLDLFSSTLNIFPSIKTYSIIKKDNHLIELYNKFDKHCYCFIDFYETLFLQRYRRYYNKVIQTNEELESPFLTHYNFVKHYSNNRKDDLKIEISEILYIFKENTLVANINNTPVRTTYDKWLQETIEILTKMQEHCINELKVPE